MKYSVVIINFQAKKMINMKLTLLIRLLRRVAIICAELFLKLIKSPW